ncbi:hypothetical protein AT251_24715 [Enterovibrio nigricans]|nr:hypothetical protein AT251_24715 [Enterovibrio nigricans]
MRLRRLMGVADQIVASRFSSIDLSNKAHVRVAIMAFESLAISSWKTYSRAWQQRSALVLLTFQSSARTCLGLLFKVVPARLLRPSSTIYTPHIPQPTVRNSGRMFTDVIVSALMWFNQVGS